MTNTTDLKREAMEPELRCPQCGYTKEDAGMWLDHHLCKGKIPTRRRKRRAATEIREAGV